MKIFQLTLFCLLCFLVGVFSFPFLESAINQNTRVVSFIDEKVENIDPTLSNPLSSPDVIEANKIQAEVLDHFVRDYDSFLAGNKPYLETRKKVREDYIAGKKDTVTLKSFSYLSSLEGKWDDYQKVKKDICVTPESCRKSTAHVELSGGVFDEQNKPIENVEVTVYGETVNPVKTDKNGHYSIEFDTLGPRPVRFQFTHPRFATAVHQILLVDPLLAVLPNQIFVKDLILHSFTQELSIDTTKKTISGDGGSIQKSGYQIVNTFTRYLIPFDAIRDSNKKPFKGKVRVVVYEFDRNSANELLQSDVFTDVRGYASQGLITYGMPLIFFYDQKGQRLEVYKEYPMQIWTTNRELNNLIQDNAMGKNQPGFNPAEYEEASSPENVAKYIQQDEEKGYQESQKNPGMYPITFEWILQNRSRLPGFWVYDQFSGLWENSGYSLVEKSTNIAYSIHTLFWTKK